ncbi:hypothetical protein, partial [Bacillus thuringiensis]|uniref:hypothetical protein n=1 Tax=Bacillus thuringiensis TaxID=1428 RepID=UPI001C930116
MVVWGMVFLVVLKGLDLLVLFCKEGRMKERKVVIIKLIVIWVSRSGIMDVWGKLIGSLMYGELENTEYILCKLLIILG